MRSLRGLLYSIAWSLLFSASGVGVLGCSFDTSPILDPRSAQGGRDAGDGGQGGAGAGAGADEDSGTPDDGGMIDTDRPCRANAFLECRGDTAIRCAPSGRGRIEQDCAGSGCNEAEGGCNVCAPGETFCAGPTTLATCGDDGLVESNVSCDDGCSSARNPPACNTCSPDASFCADAVTLRHCNPQGDFDSDEACPQGCSDGASGERARCNRCQPDEVLGCADQDNQRRCNADGTDEELVPCANGCTGAGFCNLCVPDAKQCVDDNTLRTCNGDGTGSLAPDSVCPYGCSSLSGGPACNACTPNGPSCQGMDLVQCSAQGTITTSDACTFGCNPATSSCSMPVLLPTNLPATTCTTQASGTLNVAAGVTMPLDTSGSCTEVIDQAGAAPDICVMRYSQVTLAAGSTLNVTGSRALALVSTGTMSLAGVIDASGDRTTGGPGSSTSGGGVGRDARGLGVVANEDVPANAGGGGGGFGTPGASGGDAPNTCAAMATMATPPCADPGAGGAAVGGAMGAALSPLRGGSKGGKNSSGPDSTRTGFGGGGGGAVQIVACTSLSFATGMIIDVGGGGGEAGKAGASDSTGMSVTPGAGGGGGSGGGLLIESPVITFGAGVVLVANGGSGGGGATRTNMGSGSSFEDGNSGVDGQRNTTAAIGGGSGGGTSHPGGAGGAANLAPAAGGTATMDPEAAGGGGGAVGRIRINNTGGNIGGGPVTASPTASVGTVQLQ